MALALVSELGRGFGHASRLAGLRALLGQLDVTPLVVIRDVNAYQRFDPEAFGFDVMPAPFRFERLPKFQRVNSFCDILTEAGFSDSDALAARLSVWRSLFDRWHIDIVVTELAPTALLAATLTGRKVLQIGSGFGLPPVVNGVFPSLTALPQIPEARRRERQAVLYQAMQRACRRAGLPSPSPMTTVYQSLDHAFSTFASVDHYGGRDKSRYLGPMMAKVASAAPAWPAQGRTPRVFAYVDWRPQTHKAIEQVAQMGYQLSVVATAAPNGIFARYPNVVMNQGPIDMDQALASCDVFLNHASHQSVIQAMLAGVPMLLAPTWQEHGMTAGRVRALGTGVIGMGPGGSARMRALLDAPEAYARACRQWAADHVGIDATANHLAVLRETLTGRSTDIPAG